MPEFTDEQKAHRVGRFRKIVKYRIWFGWVFALVGASLLGVGLNEDNNPLVILNGVCFLGYGLYMVRQAQRALKSLS